ncbi:FACT complex subunit SSRP1-like [Oopsacas minuta]|uniref:FACT complex subunit SSRP1-like n=1 Tax=Oopsacas minuta TaxID=111878 RepID=A0AAV7JGY5_9METZ|nr:FACT complex subunit SSRP1-like [Oopsacas minuta]
MHPPADIVTESFSTLELCKMESAEYSDIFSLLKGVLDKGKLKLEPDRVLFKYSRTGKVDSIAASEIKQSNWMKVAKGYEVKFMLESGDVHKFDGFNESDYPNLSEFIRHNYNLDLEEVPLNVKGWNWGKVNITGSLLDFSVEDKTAFEIPLSQVNKSTHTKNEITLEFHQSEEAPVCLVEMRFHIPTNPDNEEDTVKVRYTTVNWNTSSLCNDNIIKNQMMKFTMSIMHFTILCTVDSDLVRRILV